MRKNFSKLIIFSLFSISFNNAYAGYPKPVDEIQAKKLMSLRYINGLTNDDKSQDRFFEATDNINADYQRLIAALQENITALEVKIAALQPKPPLPAEPSPFQAPAPTEETKIAEYLYRKFQFLEAHEAIQTTKLMSLRYINGLTNDDKSQDRFFEATNNIDADYQRLIAALQEKIQPLLYAPNANAFQAIYTAPPANASQTTHTTEKPKTFQDKLMAIQAENQRIMYMYRKFQFLEANQGIEALRTDAAHIFFTAPSLAPTKDYELPTIEQAQKQLQQMKEFNNAREAVMAYAYGLLTVRTLPKEQKQLLNYLGNTSQTMRFNAKKQGSDFVSYLQVSKWATWLKKAFYLLKYCACEEKDRDAAMIQYQQELADLGIEEPVLNDSTPTIPNNRETSICRRSIARTVVSQQRTIVTNVSQCSQRTINTFPSIPEAANIYCKAILNALKADYQTELANYNSNFKHPYTKMTSTNSISVSTNRIKIEIRDGSRIYYPEPKTTHKLRKELLMDFIALAYAKMRSTITDTTTNIFDAVIEHTFTGEDKIWTDILKTVHTQSHILSALPFEQIFEALTTQTALIPTASIEEIVKAMMKEEHIMRMNYTQCKIELIKYTHTDVK